jgi:hypothetical protein
VVSRKVIKKGVLHMKRLLLIIIMIISIIIIVTACQGQNSIQVNQTTEESTAQLSMEEKLSDFEYMYKILEENYPFFEVNKRINGIDWLANKNQYINMINLAVTDQQYIDTLHKIVGDLNNGHTHILNKKFFDYVKDVYGTDKVKYSAWLKQLNEQNAVLRYSDKSDKAEQIESNSDSTDNNIIPYNVQTLMLIKDKVALLGIGSLNPFNIEGDMEIIKPFLQKIKDYDALIIDIRQNGGGSSSYWEKNLVPMLISKPIEWNNYFVYRGGEFSEDFLKGLLQDDYKSLKPIVEIAKEGLSKAPPEIVKDYKYYLKFHELIQPKDSINFKGKIYLLIDRKVYSSSEMFAVFAKDTGFATLVGETTGGDGIGQDPLLCALPKSGYVLRFSSVMGLTADGSCDEEHKTEPDIKVPARKTSNVSKDEAIQYVLNLYK